MKTLNEGAYERVSEMIEKSHELGISVIKTKTGSTVLDVGIGSNGSYEAGRLFAEACMGGFGEVSFGVYPELSIPSVTVQVANPAVACLASQYAGWALKEGDFFALGSGPARSLYCNEPLYSVLEYKETSPVAVLAIESSILPPESLLDSISRKCEVDPRDLYVLVAPSNSLAGAVQIVSRVVETGVHKLFELGYDTTMLIHGYGICPISPTPGDFMTAMGWTNDAVLYGGKVWFTLCDKDSAIDSIAEKLPSASSKDYGLPFSELFKRYNYDFYHVDPMLFSPASVSINNIATGRWQNFGRENLELLRREWFEQ